MKEFIPDQNTVTHKDIKCQEKHKLQNIYCFSIIIKNLNVC